jgi:hypothetical protein
MPVSPLFSARALREGLGFRQQTAAAPQQVFALGSELHPPSDPIEQRHTELAFQGLYVARNGRLAQM